MQYNGSIIQNITLDVSQFNPIAPILVKQKDAYTRGFKVTITDSGTVLQIQDSAEVWFNCENLTEVVENGVTTTKRASVEGTVNADGTVTVFVPSVVMEVAGNIQCDISIITTTEINNELTSQVLKTMTFMLDCQKAANPSGTSSTAEDDILVGLASGTIVPPSGDYVPYTRTIAGIGLSANISAGDLADALWDDLTIEERAIRQTSSKATITNLKPVMKGQYYFSTERGVIGVKRSEAIPETQSGDPLYIESYDTTTVNNKLSGKADIESGSLESCENVYDNTKHLSGSYQLTGDICTLSATAPIRQGESYEAYYLPVTSDGYSCGTTIYPDSVSAPPGTLYRIAVSGNYVVVKLSNGADFSSSTNISFTISYKYGGS